MDEPEGELWSDLIDLTGIDLKLLDDLPEDVLTVALRRVLSAAEEDDEWTTSGFRSFI